MKDSIKQQILIYVVLFVITSLKLISCKNVEEENNKLKSLADDDEIATIISDNENELGEALKVLNEYGGTIYIDTPIINIQRTLITLSGTQPGGIIGVRQPSGEYPRFNFVHFGEDTSSGIVIYSDNNFIEYIIIENSYHYGILIFGNNNIIDHVISRYNIDSGFLISGDFNTLNYCYSYRNGDTDIFVVDSDGFKIPGELNNVFNYCYAWDNSNSGFNYVRTVNSSDLSYVHCGSWNNGNVDVFTGRYDYDNGNPLDKNLWTIKDIIKSDENFVSNYYNKQYNINKAKIGYYYVKDWISFNYPLMDGEGFTFGNVNSSQSIDVKRNSFNNVAFDHKSGGFVDNYIHKYNAFVTNCVSFNNGINYRFPYYRLSKWANNWSWNSKRDNQINKDAKLKTPSNINTAQRQFYSVRDQIIKAVAVNTFPDGVNFDRAINQLKE